MSPIPSYAADIATAMAQSVDFPNLRKVVDAHVGEAVADPRIANARRIFIGGSGDSWFSALCVAPALRRWTGLPAEARSAMELARYDVPLLGPDDLVIGVSNSGSSSRARETVLLARSRGCPTLGVTGSLTGPLARQADRIIHRPVHETFDIPADYGRCFLNMAEFIAVLYGLYAFGLALGVRRGHISETERGRQMAGIEQAIAALPAVAAAIEPGIAALAEQLDGIDTIWAVGAGPSLGTARYLRRQVPRADADQRRDVRSGGMGASGIFPDPEMGRTRGRHGYRTTRQQPGPRAGNGDRDRQRRRPRHSPSPKTPTRHSPRRRHGSISARVVNEWISPILYHLPAQLLVLHMARRAGIAKIPLHRHDTALVDCKRSGPRQRRRPRLIVWRPNRT